MILPKSILRVQLQRQTSAASKSACNAAAKQSQSIRSFALASLPQQQQQQLSRSSLTSPISRTQTANFCFQKSPAFFFSKGRYSVSTTDGRPIPTEIDELSIRDYHSVADEFLEDIVEQLESVSEKHAAVDVDYADGVLNLELPPLGDYVINKQPPNKQIWLSSPISGPNRYDLVKGKWTSLRDGSELKEVLEAEVGEAIGDAEFKFD